MKRLLFFIVSVALMAQLCDCSDSSHEEDRQARPTRGPKIGANFYPHFFVPRFQDCLVGPNEYSMCIPAKKPAKCPTASWKQIVPNDYLEKCA
jgi:hypothetical protein